MGELLIYWCYLIVSALCALYLAAYAVAMTVRFVRRRRGRSQAAASAPTPGAAGAVMDAGAMMDGGVWNLEAEPPAPTPTVPERGPIGFSSGLACFAASVLLLLYVCSYLQAYLGLWGMILTELVMIGLAVIWALASKAPLREVFSLRPTSFSKLFGAAALWYGALMGIAILNNLLMLLVPELFSTVEGLEEFIYSGPALLGFFAIAVAPAVCEEALHRGVILYGCRHMKSKTAIVLVMGLLFGLFHVDPARFLSTALLGMAMTYAALETGSILAPVVMHFLNNLYAWGLPLLLRMLVDAVDDTAAAPTYGWVAIVTAVFTALTLLVMSLTGLTVGKLLLQGGSPTRRLMSKPFLILLALLLATAVAFCAASIASADASSRLFETQMEFSALAEKSETPFTVPADGWLTITAEASVGSGHCELYILDPDGARIFSSEGASFSIRDEVGVAPGEYRYGVVIMGEGGQEATDGGVLFMGVFSPTQGEALLSAPPH